VKVSTTLSIYLALQFVFWLVSVFLIFMAIAMLFDVVEMLRRTADKDEITLGLVLHMSLLKLPFLAQTTLPFMTLFAAMLTFWRLARANEAVVARAAGISAWQFILPAFLITLFLGLVAVTLVNPVSAAMLEKFQKLEAEHVKNRTSMISVSQSGLWLRQLDGNDGHSIIHALRVSPRELVLHDVIIFRFDKANHFRERIDAPRAILREADWLIPEGWLSTTKPETRPIVNLSIRTELTKNNILESFAPPETMSFWRLPDFIKTIEAAGFSGHRHRLHFYALIAFPLLLSSMIFIAASFTLRINRRTGTSAALLGGLSCSFALYFITDIVHALGLSASVPIVLAAWTPAGVSTLVGLAMLFHLEDG
jgi:lipopolysaccharide export system permease protein